MSFTDVGGSAIRLTESPMNLRRKAEFLRKFAVGSLLQRADIAAAYTPVLLDLGTHLALDSVSDVNWTLEADFPAGGWFMVSQLGAGRATFVAGTGATVNSNAATARTLSQHSQIRADVISNPTGSAAIWLISGDVG